MKKQHEAWIAKAEDDLNFARVGLKEGFYAQVCYLSQQVIEKSLKACLVFAGKLYPKSHSLTQLSKMVTTINFDPWYKRFEVIEEYYVPVRYPDAAAGMKPSGPPNQEEAQQALQTAEDIFETVTKTLSGKGL